MRIGRREFLQRGLAAGWAIVLQKTLWAEGDPGLKKRFNMEAGSAARTLREAAQQGGVDIVFSADMVKGVRTRSINGDYTPVEAFNLMLGDSRLIAVKHQKSGVYLIKRQKDPVAAKG